MDLNKIDFSAGLGATLGLIIALFWKRLKVSVLYVFGGSFDKSELAGVIFLLLLIYMIIMEGNRVSQWSLYNDLYILSVTAGAMTGLGLKSVLTHFQRMKGYETKTENKVEITETTEIKKKDETELP